MRRVLATVRASCQTPHLKETPDDHHVFRTPGGSSRASAPGDPGLCRRPCHSHPPGGLRRQRPRAGSGGTGEPREGGDITFLIDSLGDTWIPNNSSISSFQGHIWGHVTDKLVYVDEQGEVSPWIAESWEQNDDATEFTLHLKDGVTFSDGTPLDAAAVVENLDIWAFGGPNDGINPVGLFPKTYDHAEAVDATTVKVVLRRPDARVRPDPRLPRLDPHLAEDARAAGRPAGRPVQDIGTRPVRRRLLEGGRQRHPDQARGLRLGPRAPSATPARPISTRSPTSSSPSPRPARAAVQSGQADVAYNASPQELDSFKDQGFAVAVPRYLGFVNGYRSTPSWRRSTT